MSTDENAPDDLVGGGVQGGGAQGGAKPVPRGTTGDPEDQPGPNADAPGMQPEQPDSGSSSDATNPPGPAQEQDDQTGDDRGLTTDPGSSD